MAVSGSKTDTITFAGGPARRAWLLILAIAFALGVLTLMQQYLLATLNGRPVHWQDMLFYVADWLAIGLLTPLAFHLGQQWPIRGLQWRTFAVHIAGVITFAVAWALLAMLFGLMLHRYPAERPYLRSFGRWFFYIAPLALIVYVGVLGCGYAYSYAREARDRAAHAARLTAQLAEARLDALRMQLNPHFLFNSLNTVAVLVREHNFSDAGRMLDLLAGVLRQVLLTDRPHEVPFENELDFLTQYLAIEQVRFSDRLTVHWLIQPEARAALVPDFIMQPMVENAIKHGVTKRAQGGTITVAAAIAGAHLELSVADDGTGIDESASRIEGVGLTNTRERLRALYGEAASIAIETSEAGTKVQLRLPFRQRPSETD